jgi:hypothetical protein
MNVSYKKEEVMQSVSPQLLAKRDWQHSIYISPVITMKSRTFRSALGKLQLY